MFSSNQVLQISGDLNPSDIKNALDYAMELYGFVQSPIGWQFSEDNKFCIGKFVNDNTDWNKFPLDIDFDTELAAVLIYKYLNQQEYILDGPYDGAYEKGFLMKTIKSDTKIKSSFYGIVSFEVFVNFYAK